MELQVHRSRFVDWSPTGITCMAFPPLPPPPLQSPKGKEKNQAHPKKWFGTLAIGRANGNIELLEWTGGPSDELAPQAWTLKKILTGPLRSKVESLAFALRRPRQHSLQTPPVLSDLRLFSSGGGTDLVEWDTSTSTIMRTYPVHGGSIWSIAVNPSSTLLACGCDDGTVRILSLEDDNIEMFRTMGPSKGKVLSVAWGPPSPNPLRPKEPRDPNSPSEAPSDGEDADEAEWIDQWIATGGSDAAVKRWSIKSGTVVANLKTDQLRSTRTLVWAIGVLADGTIVSGDSMGLVKFWDTRTSTQLNSIKAHEADVLCLAIGSDGTTVLTSGVDQNITECALVRTKTEYGQRADWVKTSCRRLHAHDVRALAVWPPYTPFPPSSRLSLNPGTASLLVSGGQDMIPVITPCTAAGTGTTNALLKTRNPLAINENLAVVRPCTFSQSVQERIPYPIHGLVCVAKDARLLVCRRLTGVSIWRLHPGGGGTKGAQEFDHVIDMEMNVSTHIIACAISDDGDWLAVSDATELKLFYINGAPDSRPVRIKNISTLLIGALDGVSSTIPSAAASGLLFTPDSTRLVVGCSPTSAVVMFDLPRSLSGDVRHLRTFTEHSSNGAGRVIKKLAGGSSLLEDASRRHSPLLTAMAVSPDGQWLATADEHGRCNVFNLDSHQHHCTLPSFERSIRDMKFHSDSPQILVLAQVNNSIQVFDVESRTFPGWAKNVTANLPEKFRGLKPGVEGLLFVRDSSSTTKHQLLAWGWNWICKIKLDGPTTKGGEGKKSRSGWIPKDEWDLERDSLNIFSGYRHMLGVASLGGNEMVVVERPALDLIMVDGLPPSFYKHKFGT
ncbi:hypothetical protein M407DRAFT_14831 [Tulasnella calospora MUT 4182]|uniref:Anaphase-promoting complex subunit 4 WD40 domain-containing protein n=1 Tax=Tulasnella calospora MUT 4182 TaxID=1051891 RepID=A0A0C3QM51_9AGAM|nr:hypothetical protein M407DRAFT_14831 [Tulasnella calospora MUT 4182]